MTSLRTAVAFREARRPSTLPAHNREHTAMAAHNHGALLLLPMNVQSSSAGSSMISKSRNSRWLTRFAAVEARSSGVGARMRAGLRASNRRARHLPMRYETGLPSSVIRFRTLHASTASRRCPDELRARRQSPTIDLYRKNAFSTHAC